MIHPAHFVTYEQNVVGFGQEITTPYGNLPLIYADWAASGRQYTPIEQKMAEVVGPWIANTHTETNATGTAMTQSYHEAQRIIKEHVGADENDALLLAGSGMTSAVSLLQRILGWRIPEQFTSQVSIPEGDQPLIVVSELEHHSNHTTWEETIGEVVLLPGTETQPVDLNYLERLLADNRHRTTKVAAVTAASNVTGVRPPIHDIAAIMHKYGGRCFVDYTCAAPYEKIDMHPSPEASLDAIYFSPHKFLGGPGAPGVLVFDKDLYHNTVPDRGGGGTVLWTNRWGGRHYYEDIEVREDGGTPPFLGAIRAALAIRLKEQMGLPAIAEREHELTSTIFSELGHISGLSILAPNFTERVPVFSLTVKDIHYNLGTRLLNDHFGIQIRGGCACAGTYGHTLFGIDRAQSKTITDLIDSGDLSKKPGFMRVSLHPTMSNQTVQTITDALKILVCEGPKMAKDYVYDPRTNEFTHKKGNSSAFSVDDVFQL